jgi:hypothetical protein
VPEIKADPKLIAACGLYCGACGRYLKGTCPGCAENQKAGWCQIRSCNMDLEQNSCAECKSCPDPIQCAKFNNVIGKVFALIFNSNRPACITKLKEHGPEKYSQLMAQYGRQSLPRKGALPF